MFCLKSQHFEVMPSLIELGVMNYGFANKHLQLGDRDLPSERVSPSSSAPLTGVVDHASPPTHDLQQHALIEKLTPIHAVKNFL